MNAPATFKGQLLGEQREEFSITVGDGDLDDVFHGDWLTQRTMSDQPVIIRKQDGVCAVGIIDAEVSPLTYSID